MRAYFFGNMYLSSIQQGIQAAHAMHEMFTKYAENGDDLWEWANNHKTMILLNGGYADTIRELIARFESPENPYCWAPFYEGQDSLDGALTTVGIVLPEKIYESSAYIRSLPFRKRNDVIEEIKNSGTIELTPYQGIAITYELSKWEFELVQKLNEFGMAK